MAVAETCDDDILRLTLPLMGRSLVETSCKMISPCTECIRGDDFSTVSVSPSNQKYLAIIIRLVEIACKYLHTDKHSVDQDSVTPHTTSSSSSSSSSPLHPSPRTESAFRTKNRMIAYDLYSESGVQPEQVTRVGIGEHICNEIKTQNRALVRSGVLSLTRSLAHSCKLNL